MKKVLIIAIFLSASWIDLSAQTAQDALRYSRIFYNGTSRFAATAGAFGAWTSLGLLTDSDDWVTQELSVTPSDIYSIQIKLEPETSQTVPSDFEINDISIIYRTKGVHE